MSAVAQKLMTVDDFLAWAEGQEGRWELQDGALVAMAPERAAHSETKGEVFVAPRNAIARAKAPCRAMPDGATVRIDNRTAFEPNALVYSGPRLPPGALETSGPIIGVEVLSPSTAARDHGVKLEGYFSLPSVMHYLTSIPTAAARSITSAGRAISSKRESSATASCGSTRLDSRSRSPSCSRRSDRGHHGAARAG